MPTRPRPPPQPAVVRRSGPTSVEPSVVAAEPPPIVPGDASPLGRRLAAAAPPDARARANMEVGLLSGGAVQDFWIPCEAGRCFIAIAVSDEEDREVDLALSDDRGRRVGFIDPDGSVAVLRHCSEATRTLRVRVHLEEGMGRFALQIFDEAPSRGPGEVDQ